MFDKKSLTTLEYDKILNELSTFAQSEEGKVLAKELTPYESLVECNRALDETKEADKILFEYSINPSLAVDDISETLIKAKKGACLTICEIMKVGRTIRISRRVKDSIKKLQDSDIKLIPSYATMLYANETLEKDIYESFISDTEVADNASPELKAIRFRIKKINDNIKVKLQQYVSSQQYSKFLSDQTITMRGDRYVIPVKSNFKGAIQGLVHDQSASGATLFVEPLQVVEMNNDLKVELVNEQLEIEKILRKFSASISASETEINNSYKVLLDLDLIFAKAELAHDYKAIRPVLNDKGIIKIREGRHPLIAKEKVVPISLSILENDKMLLITGPNTGGKTVTLKLVGLFSLLAMTGIFLPCKEANISIFDGVYSDIGDEQSIEQSLSTFSSHIKNTIEIVSKITSKSLVLFDELGAGTDPSEGAALAIAISEKLLDLNCKSMITSHFNDLKEFALVQPGVVSASMEFDSIKLTPTYHLIMGAIGSSNALYIAEKLGLSKDIISNAKSKLSKEKVEFDNVLNAAEQTRLRATDLVVEAQKDRELAANELKDIEKEKKIIAQKKEKLDETVRKETKRLIQASVLEANDILDQIKDILDQPEIDESDLFKARVLKKKLETMSANYNEDLVVPAQKDNSELKVGDNVYVISLDQVGKVLSFNQKGEPLVQLGKIKSNVKKGNFYKVKK